MSQIPLKRNYALRSTLQEDLKKNQIETPDNKEIIALIAYLQRLGADIKVGAASSTAPQPGGNP